MGVKKKTPDRQGGDTGPCGVFTERYSIWAIRFLGSQTFGNGPTIYTQHRETWGISAVTYVRRPIYIRKVVFQGNW